jgi:hypothetical protein
MPSVRIYHRGKIKETKEFRNSCWLVWNDVTGLTSIVDMEQSKETGIFMSRVYDASTDPELRGVFPDWELLIDDVIQPQRFYESVKGIDGKVVKLRFEDYECVLDFT